MTPAQIAVASSRSRSWCWRWLTVTSPKDGWKYCKVQGTATWIKLYRQSSRGACSNTRSRILLILLWGYMMVLLHDNGIFYVGDIVPPW
ncbi:predicted protein [Lichtheimia corymbifera JMRC:FSU:9682]|uniref:Uncharacterized protein n=1 Tax=Lichtheimia corymbifera JMRC:FSU:9682 TaxID=1263082 RepID=A0A068SIP1_9FUNG|nr:predicted protein [Lichtheimia corymbifera JMRC:FSU:9682]